MDRTSNYPFTPFGCLQALLCKSILSLASSLLVFPFSDRLRPLTTRKNLWLVTSRSVGWCLPMRLFQAVQVVFGRISCILKQTFISSRVLQQRKCRVWKVNTSHDKEQADSSINSDFVFHPLRFGWRFEGGRVLLGRPLSFPCHSYSRASLTGTVGMLISLQQWLKACIFQPSL